MKALPLIVLFALAGAAGAAADVSPKAPLVLDDLTFETRGADWDHVVQIESKNGRSQTSLDLERMSDAVGISAGSPDGPARFTVIAEAGRTECAGTRRHGRATGTCRFVSSPAYETGLAQRGVELERRRDLLALALVGAELALVDDLSREGLAPRDSGNLIAAAALGVTGAWTHDLREAGLRLSGFDDLIAARALKVDAGFVKAMGAAGYPSLSAEEAITMKAVGVTPAYAQAMNRAVGVADAVDGMGELQ